MSALASNTARRVGHVRGGGGMRITVYLVVLVFLGMGAGEVVVAANGAAVYIGNAQIAGITPEEGS